MIKISAKTVRRLAVTKQFLAGDRVPATKPAVYDLVHALGCLQLDPIRAVERTQYLVLWSRLGNYDRNLLDQLVFEDRRLFEYWAHCASIVCTEDFPLFHAIMDAAYTSKSAHSRKVRQWLTDNAPFAQFVRQELKERGALLPNEIEDRALKPWQSTGWSNLKNVTQLLNILWSKGEVVVAERSGLQKKWALSEQFLPDWTPRERLTEEEVVRRAVQRSLKALGVGTAVHIRNHFIRGYYPNLASALKQLVSEKRIHPVQTPWAGEWYIHTDDLPLLETEKFKPRTTLLSPFDNLICNRDRTELMWEFYFRIEIYVPKAKRQYGYYVLPVLHGENLIGRISPIMDRKKKVLTIDGSYAENPGKISKKARDGVVKEIKKLSKWVGAESVRVSAEIDHFNLRDALL